MCEQKEMCETLYKALLVNRLLQRWGHDRVCLGGRDSSQKGKMDEMLMVVGIQD